MSGGLTIYYSKSCQFCGSFFSKMVSHGINPQEFYLVPVEDGSVHRSVTKVPAVIHNNQLYEGSVAFAWLNDVISQPHPQQQQQQQQQQQPQQQHLQQHSPVQGQAVSCKWEAASGK